MKKILIILYLIISNKTIGQTKNDFKFSVGEKIPNIELNDENGNLIKINSIGNNLVLIDFWASWCQPCRVENRTTFQKIYDEFNNKGFVIASISFDTNKNKWINAIQSDKMRWINLSDLLGFNSELYKLFKIKSLPTSLLMDVNTKKIIAVNIRGEGLYKFLDNYYSNLYPPTLLTR